MKLLLPLGLLVLAAAPAYADDAEGSGWTVKIPPGYKKQIDSCSSSGGG